VVGARYRRNTGDDSDDSLYRLAIARLTHGDVKPTAYGIRVAVRPDLGDDRISAEAYWPGRSRGCLCYSMKSRGHCSHDLATQIFQFEESEIR